MQSDDERWLDAAARTGFRGVPLARPNPAVGAIVVKEGRVVGRGWTQPGGRPHAEAVALERAGTHAWDATLYVSLEPCAHMSHRGPACADLVAASGVRRVVIGCLDPDKRTAGAGIRRLRSAGLVVDVIESEACRDGLAGYLNQKRFDRPHITLKLALSKDLRLARPAGQDPWLTGEIARAHVHAQRAKMDAILVGRGTYNADKPRLDVRLPGLAERSPERWLLTRSGRAPRGWHALRSPGRITRMADIQWLMVEGGAETARAFLAEGLVDRLMLYRAPVTAGGDAPVLEEFSTRALEQAGWRMADCRPLGSDWFEVYEWTSCSPE